MRRPLISNALLVFFVLTTAACSESASCTLMGCTDSVTVEVLAAPGSPLKVFEGKVTAGSEVMNIACGGGAANKAGFACQPDGTVTLFTSAETLVIQLGEKGAALASPQTVKPNYKAVQPNGAGCEPTCKQATVVFVVGAASQPDAGSQADGVTADAGGSTDGGGGGDAGSTQDAGDPMDTATGTDAGSTDAGQTDAGQTDAGQTDAGGVADSGQMDAGAADAGIEADAGAADAAIADTTGADTAGADPLCCGDGTACKAGKVCVGTICVDSSGLKPGECWSAQDCSKGEVCKEASICPCGAMCILPDKPGSCTAGGGCAHVTPGAYGMCDMLLGVGWDGAKCVFISGCSCGQDCAALFKTVAECEKSCTN